MRGDGSGRASAVLLGLPDFMVLAAGEVDAGRDDGDGDRLRRCGVVAEPHGRQPVLVRDLPAAGRPMVLVWAKRLGRCPEPRCQQRTWSKTHPQVTRPAMLTEPARRWAMRRVGQQHQTVAGVARQLGVGWHTVLRAVRDDGEPLVDDPNRLAEVAALGVDGHVWCHPGPGRPARFATGIVDVTRGRPPRLLDVVPGRSGKVYADWIAEREAEWRQRVQVAALDPVRWVSGCLHGSSQPGRYRAARRRRLGSPFRWPLRGAC